MFCSVSESPLRQCRDISLSLFRPEKRSTGLTGKDFKLFNGSRAAQVAGYEQGFVILCELFCEFCAAGCFSAALKPYHHDKRRRLGGNSDSAAAFAHDSGNFLIDNGGYLLCRHDGLQDICADCTGADVFNELLHDLVVDVGFKKRTAYFAERLLNVVFGQLAAAAQAVEDVFKPFFKCVKHDLMSFRRMPR